VGFLNKQNISQLKIDFGKIPPVGFLKKQNISQLKIDSKESRRRDFNGRYYPIEDIFFF